MKSITIHGLDDTTDEAIRKRALAEGLSLNRTIKALLREVLGLAGGRKTRRQDFEGLCGTWSPGELEAFTAAIEDFHQIDVKDWK